jgi:tRNA (cmo5U34)-methyltransferase
MDKPTEFSFAGFAPEFDRYITASIRGYDNLRTDCVGFSQHFIQKNSVVLDIGCSSGELLRSIRDYNQKRYPSVKYIGIDVEGEFKAQWFQRRVSNVKFKKIDVRKYDGFKNLSVVYSLFTMQFLPERDRLKLVKKIYKGLNDGGAFIFAEKVLCKNAKFQDMLTFMYYDYKKLSFTEKEIFDKERSIRDQMHLWSEFKLFEMLRSAGFVSSYTQLFWRNHLFVGILAVKAAKYR